MFLEFVHENNATICGYLPIAVMLKALEEEKTKIELLKYYHSIDVLKENKQVNQINSVSYASIVIYKKSN